MSLPIPSYNLVDVEILWKPQCGLMCSVTKTNRVKSNWDWTSKCHGIFLSQVYLRNFWNTQKSKLGSILEHLKPILKVIFKVFKMFWNVENP